MRADNTALDFNVLYLNPDKKKIDYHAAYHNTELLLKKYRRTKWSLKGNMNRLHAQLSQTGAAMEELREMMERHGLTHAEIELHDLMNSCELTSKIIDLIEIAMEHLREEPEVGEEYYWILYYAYLSEKPIHPVESLIGELQKQDVYVSRCHYYHLKRSAIKALGDILWGYMSRDIISMLRHYQDWLELNRI